MTEVLDAQKEEYRMAKLTRAGVTIGLLCALGAGGIEVFRRIEFLHMGLLYGVLVIAGFGAGLLLIRMETYRQPSKPEDVLFFYRNPHYWGTLLMLVSLIIYAFCPRYEPVKPQPRVVVKAVEPAPAPVVVVEAPPEFPQVQVSAIVLNGGKSSATMNGKVVMVGEKFKGAELVSVNERSVTLRIRQFEKSFPVVF